MVSLHLPEACPVAFHERSSPRVCPHCATLAFTDIPSIIIPKRLPLGASSQLSGGWRRSLLECNWELRDPVGSASQSPGTSLSNIPGRSLNMAAYVFSSPIAVGGAKDTALLYGIKSILPTSMRALASLSAPDQPQYSAAFHLG